MRTRYPLIVVIAIVVGLAIGVSAAVFNTDPDPYPAITGVSMGTVTFLGARGIAWVLLVGNRRPEARLARKEDSVERRWMRRAYSGAFVDLLIVMVAVTLILVITRWDVQAFVVVSMLIGMASVDWVIRMLIIRGRQT